MSIVRSVVRGAIAFLLPAAAATASNAATEPTGIAALVAGIEAQPALRARFAEDPHATLREFGVDPAPFAIGTRLTDTDVDRIVARWRSAQAGASPGTTALGAMAQNAPSPPVVVYGPPPVPAMRDRQRPPPRPTPPPPPETPAPQPAPPAPPAPVYGPPPSPSPR
jgi:hypothetical protein